MSNSFELGFSCAVAAVCIEHLFTPEAIASPSGLWIVDLLLTRVLPKVARTIRDRKTKVAQHLALNLKTRAKLLKDGIALMDYVELVTPVLNKREFVVHNFAYPPDSHHSKERGRTLRPTKQEQKAGSLWAHDSVAASNLLNLSPKPRQSSDVSMSKTKSYLLPLVDIVAHRRCKKAMRCYP